MITFELKRSKGSTIIDIKTETGKMIYFGQIGDNIPFIKSNLLDNLKAIVELAYQEGTNDGYNQCYLQEQSG